MIRPARVANLRDDGNRRKLARVGDPLLHGGSAAPFCVLEYIRSFIRMAFNQGAQVEHQKFGLGTVVSSNDERMVIKFDDHGEKKFVTVMVVPSLKKSDRAAPIEKRASRARKPKAVPAPAAAQ
jgi:hypothetical protein